MLKPSFGNRTNDVPGGLLSVGRSDGYTPVQHITGYGLTFTKNRETEMHTYM